MHLFVGDGASVQLVEVMLLTPIIRIWVMAPMTSIHLRGLSFAWLRLDRSWSYCGSEVPVFLVVFLFLLVSGSEEFGAEGKGCVEPLWNEKGKSLVSLGGGTLGDFGRRGGFWLWAMGGRGLVMAISISSDQASVVGLCAGFAPLLGTWGGSLGSVEEEMVVVDGNVSMVWRMH